MYHIIIYVSNNDEIVYLCISQNKSVFKQHTAEYNFSHLPWTKYRFLKTTLRLEALRPNSSLREQGSQRKIKKRKNSSLLCWESRIYSCPLFSPACLAFWISAVLPTDIILLSSSWHPRVGTNLSLLSAWAGLWETLLSGIGGGSGEAIILYAAAALCFGNC